MLERATYHAGDFPLQSGASLSDARLVYTTAGTLNAARDNAVVYPMGFARRDVDCEYLIGPDLALDPGRYFIVVPNLIGNAISSSPSTTSGPQGGAGFPLVTIHDNVALQQRLLLEELGVERIALAVGYSMGGQQAYEWGASRPDIVERVAVICGAARTAPHTEVFLGGVEAALTADAAFAGGAYTEPPRVGLRAISRVWAGWALSQQWYREERFRELGYDTLETYLTEAWDAMYAQRDANNMVTQLATWRHADISANDRYAGDFAAAMAAIEAEVLLLPGRTDLYFPPEDSEAEAALLRRGRVEPIPSSWGHYAGGGRAAEDLAFIDRGLRTLLGSSA